MTIQQVLEHLKMDDKKGIAVAVNFKVIPTAEWPSYDLPNAAKVMIITATQGG